MEKVRLLDVCDVYQPQTIATKSFVSDGKYDVYGANGIIGKYSDYNHKDAEVLMACRGATCGAINVSHPYSWINGNAMVVKPNGTRPIDKKYLMYFLMSANKESIISGTAQPQITRQNLKEFKIALCEEEEQQHLVTRIEELFSSLDNAVKTLQVAKEQLAVYRQAVLNEAFEGKLTNSTKRDNGILGDFIEKPRYGTSKKCDYQTGDSFKDVYRIPNIDAKSGFLSHADIKRAEFYEKEIEDLDLKVGDILIIRSNGSPSIVGTAAIVRECDINGTFAGYLMRLRIKEDAKLLPKFLLFYLSSFNSRTYIELVSKSTSGVNNINAQEISKLPIPIFGVDDQSDILKEIESRISICDQIEKSVNETLAQAEAMRQSILKEAFEGRL